MAYKWISSKFRGVRFRLHSTRKSRGRPDRYFVIRFQSEGVRREEALGWNSEGWTEQKAALKLAELKSASRTGEGPSRLSEARAKALLKKEKKREDEAKAKLRGLTFGEFFTDTYLPHEEQRPEKAPKSVYTEKGFFKVWLKPLLGELSLLAIAQTDIERVKSKMHKKGRSARTIQYCLATLRQVFNFAISKGKHPGPSPTLQVKCPKIDNRRDRFLTRPQAREILAALEKVSQRVHDMTLLALHCGLRRGEVLGLKWGAIDFDHEILNIRDTKSKRNRYVGMTEEVYAMLKERGPSASSRLVFEGRGGIRLTKIPREFREVIQALGLNDGKDDRRERIVFHTLRHTFASWLIEEGTPLTTVRDLLGHSSLDMVSRYAHSGNDSRRQAVKALGKSWRESSNVISIGERRKAKTS